MNSTKSSVSKTCDQQLNEDSPGFEISYRSIDLNCAKEKLELKTDENICQKIIEFANSKLQQKSLKNSQLEESRGDILEKDQEDNRHYQKIDFQNLDKFHEFSLEGYYAQVSYQTSIVNAFQKQSKSKIPDSSETHFIIFFKSINPDTGKLDELYAGSTNDAWRILAPFSNNQFPTQYALKASEEDMISVQTRQISGIKYQSDDIFRRALPLYSHESFDQIISSFTSTIRKTSPLFAILAKRQLELSGKKLENGPRVEISTLQIRICKDFTLEEHAENLSCIKKILSDPQAQENEKLLFLKNISSVSNHERNRLQSLLAKLICQAVQKKTSFKEGMDFAHTRISEYSKARKYYFKSKNLKKRKEIFLENSDIITDPDKVIEQIRNVLPKVDPEKMEEEIKTMTFMFEAPGGKLCKDSFLNYFHGGLSMDDRFYYKIDRNWYHISENYLQAIHTDFRQFLKKHLMTKENEGMLPEPWEAESNSFFIDQVISDILKALKEDEKDENLRYLLETTLIKCNYITKNEDGKYTAQEKCKKKFEIFKMMKREKSLADLNFPKEIQASEKLALINKIETKNLEISKVLKELCPQQKIEEKYNEKYHQRPEFIHCDRCLVDDRIEMADLILVTDDILYLYHNKMGHAKEVREVRSQIAVSALLLHKDRISSGSQKFISKMCDILEKKGKLVNKIITKEILEQKLKTKKIVYVFGSLNHTQSSLKDEKDQADEKTIILKSEIMRIELLGIEKEFRNYVGHFEFKVCEIEKKTNVSKQKNETTFPQFNISNTQASTIGNLTQETNVNDSQNSIKIATSQDEERNQNCSLSQDQMSNILGSQEDKGKRVGNSGLKTANRTGGVDHILQSQCDLPHREKLANQVNLGNHTEKENLPSAELRNQPNRKKRKAQSDSRSDLKKTKKSS